MKSIILMFFMLFATVSLFAQENLTSSQLLKTLEKPDSLTSAKVVAVNHVLINLMGQDSMINGYRIRVFFDNSQQARAEAERQREKYLTLYPNDKTYLEYTAPYFKLTVGNFVTHEEAQVKWFHVVKEFKTAFIIQERINVRKFKTPAPVVDSTMAVDSLTIALINKF